MKVCRYRTFLCHMMSLSCVGLSIEYTFLWSRPTKGARRNVDVGVAVDGRLIWCRRTSNTYSGVEIFLWNVISHLKWVWMSSNTDRSNISDSRVLLGYTGSSADWRINFVYIAMAELEMIYLEKVLAVVHQVAAYILCQRTWMGRTSSAGWVLIRCRGKWGSMNRDSSRILKELILVLIFPISLPLSIQNGLGSNRRTWIVAWFPIQHYYSIWLERKRD